jgi:site-specific recombinase XerD
MSFHISVILEKRTPRKDGTFPVKLRITIDRKSRYYSLETHLTPREFKKVQKHDPPEPYKAIKVRIDDSVKVASSVLKGLPKPSFEQFKVLFKLKSIGANVVKYYEIIISECESEGRIGTATNYKCAKKSMEKLMDLENVNFKDITPQWLKQYEKIMKQKFKSPSTISIYMRTLRTVYNRAIQDGLVSLEHYPFGKKYTIPTSENNKRPLERSDIEAIAKYNGDPVTEKYRDFFLLSYYLVGLNFADLLTIKWSQLDDNILEVVRKKTASTTGKLKKIQLVVNKKAKEIIDKHGIRSNSYVFDIIDPNDNPETVKRKTQNFNRAVNQALERISSKTNLNKKISAMYARHSAASHALANGATIADISQALGHADLKTTSNYISSLGSGKQLIADSLEV